MRLDFFINSNIMLNACRCTNDMKQIFQFDCYIIFYKPKHLYYHINSTFCFYIKSAPKLHAADYFIQNKSANILTVLYTLR